jgi:hypothetical protein
MGMGRNLLQREWVRADESAIKVIWKHNSEATRYCRAIPVLTVGTGSAHGQTRTMYHRS